MQIYLMQFFIGIKTKFSKQLQSFYKQKAIQL